MNRCTKGQLLGLLLSAPGCPAPAPSSPPPEDTGERECIVEPANFFPLPSTEDVFYRLDRAWMVTSFEIHHTGIAQMWKVDGETGARTMVPGQSLVTDRVAFHPASPLEANTLYETEYTFCGGAEVRSALFRTGIVGAPVDLPSLGGATFLLRVGEGVEGAKTSQLLNNIEEAGINMLVTLHTSTTTPEWVSTHTLPLSDLPDPCVPTMAFPLVESWENPWFEVAHPAPGALVPTLIGGSTGLVFKGALGQTGLLIDRVELGVRPADVTCELFDQIFNHCGPCMDGSGLFCITAEILAIPAELTSPFPIRTPEQIAADPDCAEVP